MPWSFLSKFALAARTEKRRAPLLDFALDSRAATVVARLPRPSVDVKPFLKGSRSTIGVAIVPKGRTAGEKRIFENAFDAGAKASRGGCASLPFREDARFVVWRQTGAEQCFANVNIAEARHNALIEEEVFQRLRLAFRLPREILGRKLAGKRFNTKRPEKRMVFNLTNRKQ